MLGLLSFGRNIFSGLCMTRYNIRVIETKKFDRQKMSNCEITRLKTFTMSYVCSLYLQNRHWSIAIVYQYTQQIALKNNIYNKVICNDIYECFGSLFGFVFI